MESNPLTISLRDLKITNQFTRTMQLQQSLQAKDLIKTTKALLQEAQASLNWSSWSLKSLTKDTIQEREAFKQGQQAKWLGL